MPSSWGAFPPRFFHGFSLEHFFSYCRSNEQPTAASKALQLISWKKVEEKKPKWPNTKDEKKAKVPMLLMTTININLWLDFFLFFPFFTLFCSRCSLLSSQSQHQAITDTTNNNIIIIVSHSRRRRASFPLHFSRCLETWLDFNSLLNGALYNLLVDLFLRCCFEVANKTICSRHREKLF